MSERDALVERITSEVLARLQGPPASTQPPPLASAGPTQAASASAVAPVKGAPATEAYRRSYEPCYEPPAIRHASAADAEDRARGTNPARRSPETVRSFVAAGATRISAASGGGAVPHDIASYIDHTMLKPDATEAEIQKLCDEAARNHFASVCVNPSFVRLCAQLLRGSDVKVCTVVGFPLGATTPATKAFESRKAIREGAREVDMVINVGALKSGNYDLAEEDIAEVTAACHESSVIVKVIIEAALLTDEEKVVACLLAKRAHADFVKTSTGFASGGATIRDVAIMRATVGPEMGVKAAGGIRSYADALGMIEAGATRIGASAGVRIVKESHGESVDSAQTKGPY